MLKELLAEDDKFPKVIWLGSFKHSTLTVIPAGFVVAQWIWFLLSLAGNIKDADAHSYNVLLWSAIGAGVFIGWLFLHYAIYLWAVNPDADERPVSRVILDDKIFYIAGIIFYLATLVLGICILSEKAPLFAGDLAATNGLLNATSTSSVTRFVILKVTDGILFVGTMLVLIVYFIPFGQAVELLVQYQGEGRWGAGPILDKKSVPKMRLAANAGSSGQLLSAMALQNRD